MDYLVKPSVNKAVSTYAVKIFLQLITRYFPKSHSIIVKVSYSCIENISKIYTGHNSKIISTQCSLLTLCYCQVKEEFSMGSNCQTTDAVSDCCVTSPQLQKTYFGLTEGKLKKRYYNHIKSFKHRQYSHEMERHYLLSSYMWYLKETLNETPKLKSVVAGCVIPYSKSVFCICMENWLLLPTQDNTNL